MLTRVVSGVLMAAAIIAVLVYLPWWGLGSVVLFAAVVCAREYLTITRPDADRLDHGFFLAALLVAIAWPLAQPHWPLYSAGNSMLAAFFLLSLCRLFRPDPIETSVQRLGTDALGLVYMGLTFPLIFDLHQRPHGGWVVILVMAITFGADTGAYFAGRTFGRHKLYEKISPKKTVEGFGGALVFGVGAVFIARALFPGHDWLTPVDCIVLGLLGATFGALGDLVESMLKRAYGVKDSGTLIPGHGGFLDRIDGLLFAGPVAWLYLEMAGR